VANADLEEGSVNLLGQETVEYSESENEQDN
jgi:hypothetical protein